MHKQLHGGQNEGLMRIFNAKFSRGMWSKTAFRAMCIAAFYVGGSVSTTASEPDISSHPVAADSAKQKNNNRYSPADEEFLRTHATISRLIQFVDTIVIAEYTGKYERRHFRVPLLGKAEAHEYHFRPITFLKGEQTDDLNVLISSKGSFSRLEPEHLFKVTQKYILLTTRSGPASTGLQGYPKSWYVLSNPDLAIPIGD